MRSLIQYRIRALCSIYTAAACIYAESRSADCIATRKAHLIMRMISDSAFASLCTAAA